MTMLQQIKDKKLWILAATVLAVPVAAGWIGDISQQMWLGLGDWVDWSARLGGTGWLWLLLSGLLLLCLGALAGAIHLARGLLPLRIHAVAQVSPHPGLIMLLSIQSDDLVKTDQGWTFKGTPLAANLDDCCKQNIQGFSWQQNLRAARHHQSELRRIDLLGSGSSPGSSPDPSPGSAAAADTAIAFLADYFPRATVTMPLRGDQAPDFENLQATHHALSQLIHGMNAHGITDEQIVIDITGGQKTASVAAAMVTLDRPDLLFQYIGTGNRTGEVFGFNAQIMTGQDL